jgi:hypothetical protein
VQTVRLWAAILAILILGCGNSQKGAESDPERKSNYVGSSPEIVPMANGSAYVFANQKAYWVLGSRRVEVNLPEYESRSIHALADGSALLILDGNLFHLYKEVLDKVDASGSELTGGHATPEGFYFVNRDGLTDADRTTYEEEMQDEAGYDDPR